MTLSELLHSCGAAGKFPLQVFSCCQKLLICERLNLKRAIRLRVGPRIEKMALSVKAACWLYDRVPHLVIPELSSGPQGCSLRTQCEVLIGPE
jgi:hypothetical protein